MGLQDRDYYHERRNEPEEPTTRKNLSAYFTYYRRRKIKRFIVTVTIIAALAIPISAGLDLIRHLAKLH